MNATDAANLLMAIAGTATTRDAAKAVRQFRPLAGRYYGPVEEEELSARVVHQWLQPLRPKLIRDFPTNEFRLTATFGEFLEYLIQSAANGSFSHFLRSIPALAQSKKNERLRRKYLWANPDNLIFLGATRAQPQEVRIGLDVGIQITFDRRRPLVEVKFHRKIPMMDQFFTILFLGEDGEQYFGDLDIECSFSEVSIAAAGHSLAGKGIPKKVQRPSALTDFLFKTTE